MFRVEVIANRSVEENIHDALKFEGAGKHYSKYLGVLGIGNSGPCMGDAIWPEENITFVFWCEEEELASIERAVHFVKEKYPDEGIKMYSMPGGRLHAQAEEESAPQAAEQTPGQAAEQEEGAS